ncbi:MAG: ABC transporter permease [Flavobacteriia bacterium]|nr:MAG: ABC transporter permease [Flavobacteriia bacterium]
MNKLKLIIQREFIAKVKNRAFIIMTFLSPLLGIGLILLVTFLTKSTIEKTRTVAYVNESSVFTGKDFQDTKSLKFTDYTAMGLEMAKETVQNNEEFGLLYIPQSDSLDYIADNMQFYSKESPGLVFIENLQDQVDNRLRQAKMIALGIDTLQYQKAKIHSNIHLNNFSGEATSKLINGIRIIIGTVAGYLIMMFIIIYGSMVMRSVIEEKTSRIIEVIISSVKPFYLMLGKVIGTAGAGIFQFLIWLVLLFILYMIVVPLVGGDITANMTPEQIEQAQNLGDINKMQLALGEIKQLPIWTIIISFILFFTGGYLLYSALYAAIGAAVDNETDSQQFMMPIMMPIILAIYVGFSVVINDPHGTIATTFSMIPFTSPIVMMMRIPMGVPLWQIIVALVLLFATFILMIWFAAKIYRVGILMYGKKPTYKELFKWLKY